MGDQSNITRRDTLLGAAMLVTGSALGAGTKLEGREMETDTPLATVDGYLDAFNRGDPEAMAAAFAVPGHILDGMAPHVWQGPTATQDWYKEVLREGKEHGASGYLVRVGEPLHNDVTGNSAYVVLPATMTFDLKGTKITQSGAVFTFAIGFVALSTRSTSLFADLLLLGGSGPQILLGQRLLRRLIS